MYYSEKINTYRNKQAYRAARFLLKNFPDKYIGTYTKVKGVLYLDVSHHYNGYGLYWRSRIRMDKE